MRLVYSHVKDGAPHESDVRARASLWGCRRFDLSGEETETGCVGSDDSGAIPFGVSATGAATGTRDPLLSSGTCRSSGAKRCIKCRSGQPTA